MLKNSPESPLLPLNPGTPATDTTNSHVWTEPNQLCLICLRLHVHLPGTPGSPFWPGSPGIPEKCRQVIISENGIYDIYFHVSLALVPARAVPVSPFGPTEPFSPGGPCSPVCPI